MRTISIRLTLIAAAAALVSCASGPNATTGGLGGAALGGIIGHQSGRGLEGAAIGAVAGGAAGNLIGNGQDQRNAQRYYGQPAYAPPPPQPYYR